MYINVHSSTIHNSQKGDDPNVQMDKQNEDPYNGTLFSNKKEWSADTEYNMDKPWKHYAK